ncbi:MAG TPA: hypothetical protein VMU56_09925, partial [Beijerinckiaceae bacterium]|nr:hypothetical protein [Beijerinckiaceae bacterium]
LNLTGTFWRAIFSLNNNFGVLGYVIIAIFVLSWVVSVAVYRLMGYGELDAAGPESGSSAPA